MAMCSFAEGFSMFDVTPLENLFIEEYMLRAPGDFVKVYIYGLRLCYHPVEDATVPAISRALGLEEKTVIYRHAFRNTLLPLITIVGGSLPVLFSGALITETLFSIPGIGYTSYQAMKAGDIPFSMFYLMFLAVLTLLGNLLSDLLYAVADPRVRIS